MIAEVSKAGLLSGTKVTTKSYTPFGEQIGEQTSGFGWNGEYYNAATGMVYLRARFYEPAMNRFSQKDLLRGSMANGMSLNRYAYCGNDPINHIDPSGETWKSALSNLGSKITTGIKNAVKNPVQTAVNALTTVAKAVTNPVSTAVNTAKAVTEKVKDFVADVKAPAPTNKQQPSSTGAKNTNGSGSASPATLVKQQVEEDTRTTGENGGKSWIKKVWENASNGMITDLENQTKNMESTSKELELVGAGIKFIGQWTKCTEQELIENQIKQTQLLYESASQVDMVKAGLIIVSTGEIAGGVVLSVTGNGVAGSTLISAGTNSLITGLGSGKSGKEFAAEWAVGEATGFVTGIGLGFAGEILTPLVDGIEIEIAVGETAIRGVTVGEALGEIAFAEGVAFVGGFGGGLLGDAIDQTMVQGTEVNWDQSVQAGISNGANAMLAAPFTVIPASINTFPDTAPVADKVIAYTFYSGITMVNEGIFDVIGYYG